jgi:hypothetical protein
MAEILVVEVVKGNGVETGVEGGSGEDGVCKVVYGRGSFWSGVQPTHRRLTRAPRQCQGRPDGGFAHDVAVSSGDRHIGRREIEGPGARVAVGDGVPSAGKR